MKFRIAGQKKHSFVDGPGCRYTLFFQGCRHHCKGCHNPETWNPAGGHEADTNDVLAEMLADKYIDGVTLSGGDPFAQPDALACLAGRLAEKGVNLWVYTGFTFEELLEAGYSEILCLIDVLVDGRFEESARTQGQGPIWRGSDNQRLIDTKKSLAEKRVVLME